MDLLAGSAPLVAVASLLLPSILEAFERPGQLLSEVPAEVVLIIVKKNSISIDLAWIRERPRHDAGQELVDQDPC